MVQQVDLGHGRGWAAPDMAASIFRIDAELGSPLQITRAGATAVEQQNLLDRWNRGDRAGLSYKPAAPANSPHVTGEAIDSNNGTYLSGVKGKAHGFTHPLAGDKPHYVYVAGNDQYTGGLAVTSPLASPFTAFGNIGTTLSDRNTWIRLGVGALGVLFLIIALARIFNQTELGQTVNKTISDTAKTGAELAVLAPK